MIHVVPSTAVSVGGPARSVLRLAMAEAQAGLSVGVVTGTPTGPDPAAQAAPRVEVYTGPHLPLPFEIPSPRLVSALRRAISGADLVHLHSLWNGTVTVAARLCRRAGVPYVISPRGMLDPVAVGQRRWFKRLYRALVDRRTADGAAGWHFLTTKERDTAVWGPGPSQRIAVVPNGVDVATIQRAARRPGVVIAEDDVPVFVYLGRLHATKGLALQVEALSLLKVRGVDARLVFVGPDDHEAATLKARATALDVADRVTVRAPVYGEERFALLRQADGVLLTSLFEGNSVSAMETLAAGGLLIATDTTHLDEAEAHGAAIVVRREAGALADSMARVLSDAAYAGALRQRAEGYARGELDAGKIAGRMRAFYESVMSASVCKGPAA